MYLLYLYSKWQSIDLYQTVVQDLILHGLVISGRGQVALVAVTFAYFALLACTVRYLRRDHISRANEAQAAAEAA